MTALEPLAVHRELPDPRYLGEGRLLHIEYPAFHFFNVYFPNGTKDDERLAYKIDVYKRQSPTHPKDFYMRASA